MTERSRGLPSPPQVIELLDGDFARAGYEIEDVGIDAATQPPGSPWSPTVTPPRISTPSPSCRAPRRNGWTACDRHRRRVTSWKSPHRAWIVR